MFGSRDLSLGGFYAPPLEAGSVLLVLPYLAAAVPVVGGHSRCAADTDVKYFLGV